MSKDEKASYYDAGGIEVLDIIKAKLSPEQYQGYLLGNIIKYSCRLFHKQQPGRDCEKIVNYANFLNNELKNKTDEVKP